MTYLLPGITFATEGPFSGLPFYVEPKLDVLNRVQFRVLTWHGKSDEDDGSGGWWHFDSIVHDREEITIYTEVTYMGGGEVVLTIPWSELDEDQEECRQCDLAEEEKAWPWISRELMKPLGLRAIEPKQISDADTEEFRKVADDVGFAKLIEE